MNANSLYTTLTISNIIEEARDVKIFEFEGAALSYQPGQYLTFVYQDRQDEVRRSYSIVSAPALHEPLAVGIRRVENGVFSRPLVDHARPGDQLHTTGVGGFFVLPPDRQSVEQVFFLAAGIGITPIFSMIKTALHDWPHLQVVLIYSNGSPAVTVFYRQLQELAAAFPHRFHLELLFSNAPDLYRAHLHADLLVSFLKHYSTAPPSRQLFYTCGPVNYMRMCTYTLQREGIPEDRIRKENFFPQKVAHRPLPPDTDRHTVTLYYKKEKILTFVIADDPNIRRTGNDLHMTVALDLYTAVLGGDVTVDTLGGKVKLKVPAETQNGTKIRLKGKGYPVYKKEGAFGDLYLTYQVKIPTNLTDRQKELFRELAQSGS